MKGQLFSIDLLVAVTIFFFVLGLAVWARVSKQTIPELIGGIIEKVRGTGEDAVEATMEIYD